MASGSFTYEDTLFSGPIYELAGPLFSKFSLLFDGVYYDETTVNTGNMNVDNQPGGRRPVFVEFGTNCPPFLLICSINDGVVGFSARINFWSGTSSFEYSTGADIGAGTITAAIRSIPEPSTLALIMVAMILLMLTRRRGSFGCSEISTDLKSARGRAASDA
jgi:hypothetical protein